MELPTVRQLQCLVAVAEQLNFRRAAESCFITQPALSAQIRLLETQLGLRLFERDRRRVLPTPAGAALAKRARTLLADLGDLTGAAASFQQPLSGVLKLGVIPTVAPYVLPRGLRAVRRRFPRLRLLLREDQTAHLVEQVDEGSLDLALLALEANLGKLQTRALFPDPFLLAVPAGHRLARRKRVGEKDLAHEDVLLLEDGHCLREQALSICSRAGACELGDFRSSSLSTLIQMVTGGLGVTLLPQVARSVESASARSLRLIPFGRRGPARTIGLAWRPSTLRQAEFQALGEALGAPFR